MSLSPPLSVISQSGDTARRATWAGRRSAEVLVALTLVLALALRLGPTLGKPLWLDEAWTGMMAAQTTVSGLAQQIRNDANAPLYYVVICLWAKLAGLSNIALRSPNVLFGMAAAGVALLQRKSLGSRTAAVWAVLLALWWPGLVLNFNARCYLLLLLTATLTTAAHVRLLEAPTRRRATAWAAAACLCVLTHYYAALLVGAQGLVLLAVHRHRVLRLWPAALMFLPGAAWGLYHLPRLQQFARPDVAWYPPLQGSDLLAAAAFVGGGPLGVLSTLGLGALALAAIRHPLMARRWPAMRLPSAAVCTAAASFLAIALCLTAAVFKPSYTVRYLTPFAPGVLLGLALLTDRVAMRISLTAVVIPLAFGVTAIHLVAALPDNRYSFEAASAYIEQGSPQRLEFFWDHPATQVEAPDQLRQVGGFFFARSGHPVQVDPIILAPGDDPNRLLIQRAEPGTAILWLYDLSLHGVSANVHSPGVLQHDPRWRCRDFGGAGIGVLACRQVGAPVFAQRES